MSEKDITDRFTLDQIDHHELLELLTLRYHSCWRISEDEVTLPAEHDYMVGLRISPGLVVERIFAGPALSKLELDNLLEQVQADLKDDRITEFGVETLFAHRPVQGAFKFDSVSMQISPAPPEWPRPAQIMANHPFVLEFPIRAYRTSELRNKRRYKNAIEWTWTLNALLNGSITTYSDIRSQQLWAIRADDFFNTMWVQRGYSVHGAPAFADGLSEQSVSLPIVAAAAYFSPVLSPEHANVPMNTFSVPDNLDTSVGAYLRLDHHRRRRFLRSAAAIYLARQLFDTSASAYFVGCVQAIEVLIDRPGRRNATQLFNAFVKNHCMTAGIDDEVLQALYATRSALAHGEYLFQLDEAPWAINIAASVAGMAERDVQMSGLTIAKTGLRTWLLAQA